MPFISVIMPCCNPGMRHLGIVLEALRNQTLPMDEWELILVDDASKEPLRGRVDLSWHPGARVVETDPERKGIGLVGSRLWGSEHACGQVCVFVDQDNALRSDYLQGVAAIAREHPKIGTWGGQILLKFDEPDKAPEPWLRGALCTRELAHDIWSNDIHHHASTPWGAGLCVRHEVLELYRQSVEENPHRRLLDPSPRRPGFGGDSDISYAGCRAGFGKGAFKRLIMDHLMPVGRCSDEYLLRTAEANGYSTVMHGYVEHGTATPPRNDWRYWLLAWVKRPRRRRLEWEIEMARREGMWKAVAQITGNAEELRDYAAELAERAWGLKNRNGAGSRD
ncbi:MAG: glycosyltransferase family 2 protein [Chthoniobacterales bacterium]|nr:glycosyltransferase family 2 protein [Chthoniobacterales bacterium]